MRGGTSSPPSVSRGQFSPSLPSISRRVRGLKARSPANSKRDTPISVSWQSIQGSGANGTPAPSGSVDGGVVASSHERPTCQRALTARNRATHVPTAVRNPSPSDSAANARSHPCEQHDTIIRDVDGGGVELAWLPTRVESLISSDRCANGRSQPSDPVRPSLRVEQVLRQPGPHQIRQVELDSSTSRCARHSATDFPVVRPVATEYGISVH